MFEKIDILQPFFEDLTREYNVREFARLKKITPATASKKLKEFSKQGLLSYRKERNLDLYKGNVDNVSFRDLKVYYTIHTLRKSGFIIALDEFYLKPTIVLYGSAAAGFDTYDSDIDILIISEKKDNFTDLLKFEKIFKKEIHLITVKKLNDLKNEHLVNNVINGIVLEGELRWT
tara:strand:+ start:4585 stop:5109 length:525 start_codon:yes stop_codon:yes gene_type:complete